MPHPTASDRSGARRLRTEFNLPKSDLFSKALLYLCHARNPANPEPAHAVQIVESGGPAKANAALLASKYLRILPHSQETVERPCLHSPTGLWRVGSGSLRLWRAAAAQDAMRAADHRDVRSGQDKNGREPRGFSASDCLELPATFRGTSLASMVPFLERLGPLASGLCPMVRGKWKGEGGRGAEMGERAAHDQMCTHTHTHVHILLVVLFRLRQRFVQCLWGGVRI